MQEKQFKTDFPEGDVAAILDSWSKRFKHFLIDKSLRYFLNRFESIGRSVQDRTFKLYV